jgi:acyl-CoA synthetase (NDP forming)/GNAT superfamily N-acetyltransferase
MTSTGDITGTAPATADPPAGAPADAQPERPETGYPKHWEADVLASDGRIVHLRPILPSDADALVRMHESLSDRTRYFRYFGPHPRISPAELKRFTVVDHRARVALICLVGDEILAVGRYEGLPGDGGPGGTTGTPEPDTAEVAFVTRDDHQGRGLGSILLEHLAAAARENGLRRFEAEVLAENHTMVRVFRQAGYQVSRAFEDGVLHLEFDIDPTEQSVAVRDAREQRAEARSVHNLLHPRSVAVIGASVDPTKIGNAVFGNLLRANFSGPVYPVNPDARSVRGVRAYGSVTDIPDEVDLAVVAVPAEDIDQVMDSCREKGVAALLVLSSGFADVGRDGTAAQRRLVTEARAHGMRVIGPNALGVANTDPAVRLNATLAPDVPGRGRAGFFAQSGALGIAILAAAKERGLGLSTFVSAGNRADVSGNDLLQYWQTDPGTDLVLLYLETFGNPRKFGRLASRLARTKPVIAVKSGRHTGADAAIAAGATPIDDAGVKVLFEQAGVIRVDTLSELFDTALLLSYQPLPRGSRVAVVGNSTALGALVSDALLDEGLELAAVPADVGADATPEQFAAAVRAALVDTAGTDDTDAAIGTAAGADPGSGAGDEAAGVATAPPKPTAPPEPAAVDDGSVPPRTDPDSSTPPAADALIAVFVPPVATPGAAYARALRTAVAGLAKPVAAVFLAAEGVPDELAVVGPHGVPGPGSIPSYPSPERAVAALAKVQRYARWRAQPVGEFVRPPGIDTDRARQLVASVGAGERHILSDVAAQELLTCYGIPVTEYRLVEGVEAALAAALELGYPVAVKAVGDRWHHRADLVGVRLDIVTETGVRRAHAELSRLTGEDSLYVQRMAPKGMSCVLEVTDDPSFGSLLSFGLSGMATELLGDRAFRAVPVSDADAAALVRAPRAAPLLTGYRGSEPVRLEALEDLVLRLGRMAEDLPELRALSLDPVLASAAGAFVTGTRVVLGPRPTRADSGPRRLR